VHLAIAALRQSVRWVQSRPCWPPVRCFPRPDLADGHGADRDCVRACLLCLDLPNPTWRAWLLGKSRRVDTSLRLKTPPTAASVTRSFTRKVRFPKFHLIAPRGARRRASVHHRLRIPRFLSRLPGRSGLPTIIAIWRLIQYNEPSWSCSLSGILVLELVICRKWCRTLCPLGALISLLSSMNVFFRPKVDGRLACA